MTTRRNDLCTCGSGKRYKHCCEGKNAAGPTKSPMMIGGMALVVAAGVLAIALNRPDPTTTSAVAAPNQAAASAPASAPAGAPAAPLAAPGTAAPADIAVPGRIWSPEHGHWHNATQTENPIVVESAKGGGPKVVSVPQPENSTVVRHPQPPGEPPPGKVWSPLHGHWHDAPAQPAATSTAPAVMDVPPPAGPTPEGKVWSREHGHWHNAPKPQQ